MSALILKNIKKTFSQAGKEFEVIKNISLEIKKSELVALIGPSGSGKTTLLQIAGLLDNATSGEIIFGKEDASQKNDQERTKIRKNKIGFIYQSHHLLPEFSAVENVAIPLLIQNISRLKALKKAEEILTKLDLQDRLNHKPAQLSGGQQQRVAIARALVTNPSIILADEPTGNLDSKLSMSIFQILKKLVKNSNTGCLLVTHNLELAKKADRIISIKDGKII